MFVLKALVVAIAIIAVNSRTLEDLVVDEDTNGNYEAKPDSNAESYIDNGEVEGPRSVTRQKRQFTAEKTGDLQFKGSSNFAPITNSHVQMASGKEESRGFLLDAINSVTGIIGIRL